MHFRALALALLLAAPVSANLWVDATRGDDRNPGTFALPLRSIGAGVRALPRATTLFVLPGLYGPTSTGERFPIDVTQADIRIFGVGGASVTRLDCENVPAEIMRFRPGAADVRLYGISLENGRTTPSDTAIEIDRAALRIEIAGCRFLRVNHGIVVRGDAATPGLQRHRIHSNLFVDGRDDFIVLHQPTGTLCFNNTCYNTPRAGIRIAADATDCQVFNNLCLLCGEGINSQNNPPSSLIEHNNCFNNGINYQGPHFARGVPPSNLRVDPLLRDPSSGDFRPQPNSPMIGAGYMAALANYYGPDYDGAARLFDFHATGSARVDIGCHEANDVSTRFSGTFGPGQTVTLRHSAPPGFSALALFALDVPGFALQPFGTFLLDPLALLPFSFLVAGTGSTPLSIPNDPMLSGGIPIYFQTLFFAPPAVFKAGNLQLGIL